MSDTEHVDADILRFLAREGAYGSHQLYAYCHSKLALDESAYDDVIRSLVRRGQVEVKFHDSSLHITDAGRLVVQGLKT